MEPVSKWFDALYISYAQKLVKMAVRMGFSEQDGQDLMQDAFLLLLSKAELFRNGHDNPAAFLILTQKHLIGDAIRRRERRKFTSIRGSAGKKRAGYILPVSQGQPASRPERGGHGTPHRLL